MTEAPKVVRFIYRWQIIRSARNNLVFSYIILVIVIQEMTEAHIGRRDIFGK